MSATVVGLRVGLAIGAGFGVGVALRAALAIAVLVAFALRTTALAAACGFDPLAEAPQPPILSAARRRTEQAFREVFIRFVLPSYHFYGGR